MTAKTAADLAAQYAADLADNTAGDIGAADVRGAFGDLTDTLFSANVNAQTGTGYTLALTDTGRVVTMSNGSANTLTIPTNAAVAFPAGSTVTVIQLGAGLTTIAGDTGVTLNGASAGSGDMGGQYQSAVILKLATDTWVVCGGIGAVA